MEDEEEELESELINIHAARAEVIRGYYGGISGLWRKLQEHGAVRLPRKTVEKWFERDRVPESRFLFILKIIENEDDEDRFFQHLMEYGYVPKDII